MKSRRIGVVLLASALFFTAFSDDAMRKLIDEKKFGDAVRRGEAVAAEARSADVWLMLGIAYENQRGDAAAVRAKAKEAYENAIKANPSHAEAYMALGNLEFKAGDFKAAAEHYQKSFFVERSVTAAEGIARSAMLLKDRDRARDAAESAIAINPDALDSRHILADILFDAKSYAAAAPHLEYVASKRAGEIDTWRKLAICYENTKEADKLAAVDAKIVELDPKDIKSRQRLAEHALGKNDTQTALKLFRELSVLTPRDPKPLKNLYEASLQAGNKKDGAEFLKNFIALDSSDANAIKMLGDLLFEAKDMDGALNEYRKAIRRNANIAGLYKNYASILIDKKLDDEALRAVQRAITLKEADAAMYIAAGDIYRKRNDNANAVRMYQAAMELDKQNAGLLTKLAEAQAAAGDTRNAIVSYEQIVALNPNATTEFKVLGDLITRAGRAKEGIDNYKKYLAKVPTDQEVLARVGMYEYANKQYKETIEFLSKVTDAKLITPEILFALGDSYNRTGDCKQAVAFLERVRAARPSNAVLVNTLRPLAECYEKIGDKAKAAEAYNAFVSLPNVRDADASYLRAFLREETDRAGAIRMYDANTKTFPRDHRNFMRLGILHSRDNTTLPQAVTNLRTASQLADTVSIIWKTLGEVQGKLKNTDGELAAYTKFLTLVPGDVAAAKRVGTIQIERRQFAAGVTNLETVALTTPDDYEVSMMLAVGYASTNRPKEAAEQYQKAKKLKTDDVAIRLSLIETLEKMGDTANVRRERRSLAELDRKIAGADRRNIESRQRLAEHSRATNDNARAYVTLKELAELTPRDHTVFQSLFEIAMALGNKKEAIAHLKSLIALRPQTADAHRSLGLMLYDEKDFDGALTAFREARRLNPAVKGIYKQYMDILIQRKIDNEIITVGTAAIAAKEIDAAGYRAMGDIHAKQNRHADAARMYKGALDLDSKNVALLTAYAESQSKSGDTRGAAVTFEQVILMNPNASKEFKELGAIQARLGNQDQAMASYKKYLEKNPSDEAIALVVANFEYGKKNFKEAIKFYEMVKKSDMHTLQYLMRLADSYFQAENFKKAAENYEKARKIRNVPPATLREILRPLAVAYERDKQLPKAAEIYAAFVALPGVVDQEASFKRAFLIEETNADLAIRHYTANIRTFPRDARNFVRLGTIYAKKKETLPQAAENLNAAIRLVDNDPAVWLLLAQVNGQLNRVDPELAAYTRYLQLKRDDVSVTRRIGEIHHGKKQWAPAITNLEMFLTTNDKDVKATVMLADAYEATNRQPRAAELLVRAKALDGKDPVVRERLYNMYKRLGQKSNAEAEIRSLVALTKDNKHRLLYFNDLIEAGKINDAANIAAEVRRSDPMNFDGLVAMATVQNLQRRHSDAIETYKMVMMANPKFVPGIIGRADAHLALGQRDRAEEFYRQALKLEPNNRVAQEKLRQMSQPTPSTQPTQPSQPSQPPQPPQPRQPRQPRR